MSWPRRLLRWGLILGAAGILLSIAAVGIAYWLISPRLPNVAEIRDIRLQVPLKVLSSDGKLIAVFGETRRTPVRFAQIPERVRNVFVAIEDARFYEHPGIDVVGIGRAVWLLATSDRERVPGGSTITQQVARNFFLSPEYSFSRKISEIFLALKMERELTKDEILELYLNKIFFGYRSYGVAAAADFYYGKTLDQLTLAEAAMLASIPKFPSSGNPLHNPERALERRNYVLQRMQEVGFIDAAQLRAALAEPDHAHPHEPPVEVEAPYLAEMVRLAALEKLGNDAMTAGYSVYTTVNSRFQDAANAAVRGGLMSYDRRHGYRGAESHVELAADAGPDAWSTALAPFRPLAGLVPGLVTTVDADTAQVFLQDGQAVDLTLESVAWAQPYLSENSRGPAPKKVSDALHVGDVVRLARNEEGAWELAQLPKAQAALVSLDPEDGAVRALVGGFSFALSKFNRATQTSRNPGSSFKPFVYSAAFERGFNAASIVNDAPLALPDPSRPDGVWRPSNDDEKFEGPMRLREAMVRSRNLVSVRVLDAIGVRYARDYISRFGFPLSALPENLSLALGTSSVPPIAMARGYSVFANGGYLVDPYFIERVEDDRGTVVFREQPARACRGCPERLTATAEPVGATAQDLSTLLGNAAPTPTPAPAPTPVAGQEVPVKLAPRAIDERNAFLITSLMHDVVLRGTGRGAMELGRNDLAGKTGTTNEHRDAWFSGFNDSLVATTWIGFDDFTSLGRGEFASKASIPIWVAYMKVALDGVPEHEPQVPNGITTARITAGGQLLDGGDGIVEMFKVEDIARMAAMRQAQESEQQSEQQPYEIF